VERDQAIAPLWRLFSVLVVLQAADLTTTYYGLSAGAREGNIFLRGSHVMAVAAILKTVALGFFLLLVLRSRTLGRPTPSRLLAMASRVAVIYVAILVNNLAILLWR
jgi:hypothetical protein